MDYNFAEIEILKLTQTSLPVGLQGSLCNKVNITC